MIPTVPIDTRVLETDRWKLRLDPADGKVTPLLTRRNLERFKGPNDLIYAKNGDMCEWLPACSQPFLAPPPLPSPDPLARVLL